MKCFWFLAGLVLLGCAPRPGATTGGLSTYYAQEGERMISAQAAPSPTPVPSTEAR